METVDIQAEPRATRKKGPARRLRAAGKAPAVFYGPKRRPLAIAVDQKEFLNKVTRLEGSHLIRFQSAADEIADKVALVKDTQYHPLTQQLVHADFYEVDMAVKLRVRAPLHFTGKAPGVALGGILQPLCRDIEVECLPGDIPEFIEVDVSGLDIHDTIHVSALQIPAGVTVSYETDFALVTVLPPTVEEVKAAEVVEEAAVAPAPAEGGRRIAIDAGGGRSWQPRRRIRQHAAQRRLRGGGRTRTPLGLGSRTAATRHPDGPRHGPRRGSDLG
jgi:large subunit ribosomal protein L25